MNTNITKLQKLSRAAFAVVRIVQVILLCSIAYNAYIGISSNGMETQTGMRDPLSAAIQTIGVSAIVLAVLYLAAAFLKSIQSEHSPFLDKNVKRLKRMAVLIAAIEPVSLCIQFIGNTLRPISAEGIKVVIHSYMGGMIIALGLIVYCIALIFEHGTILQKQSDETL